MTSELMRRIAFTLGALLIFRIGTFVPLPGIDIAVWERIFGAQENGLLGLINQSSGGAVGRLAIFALGITPYVSAAIVLQLVGFFIPKWRTLRASGARGARAIDRYTIAFTVLIAAFQAYGVAKGLEGVSSLVANPGSMFRIQIVLTLTGGTMFLVWLSDRITLHGLGNGIALLLCVGIVTELPRTLFGMFELGQRGAFSTNALLGLAALAAVLVALVTFVEKAQRREPVAFSGEVVRGSSFLSFKLNGAGMIPAFVATWVLVLPILLAVVMSDRDPAWWDDFARAFGRGQPLYMLLYAIAIFLCVYLYTALLLDPSAAAETLQKHGGRVGAVEPGEPTAEYLDRVLSRTTMVGALYFAAICLIPEFLLYRLGLPFYLGGTSLLILVCTVLDIEKQARGYALAKAGG